MNSAQLLPLAVLGAWAVHSACRVPAQSPSENRVAGVRAARKKVAHDETFWNFKDWVGATPIRQGWKPRLDAARRTDTAIFRRDLLIHPIPSTPSGMPTQTPESPQNLALVLFFRDASG